MNISLFRKSKSPAELGDGARPVLVGERRHPELVRAADSDRGDASPATHPGSPRAHATTLLPDSLFLTP
jgi:hypothetical protein